MTRRARTTRQPAHSAAMPAKAWPILVPLLVLVFATACTVRLELASPRVAPGDLAASSAGLAGHERWLAWTPGAPEPPREDGITLAAVTPIARPEVAVQLLPDIAGVRALAAAPPDPPIPAFRPGGEISEVPEARVASAAGSILLPPGDDKSSDGSPDEPAAAVRALQPGSPAVRLPDPAAEPTVVALAPGLSLASPGRRYDLAWMAGLRGRSIEPAAGLMHGLMTRRQSARRGRAGPIRLFPLAEPT